MPHDAVRPLLVFDLDGTLVDSALDLMGTLNALLVREGLLPVPVEAVGRMVGLGARVLIERGLRANGVEPEPARVDRLFADFLVHYGDNIAVSTLSGRRGGARPLRGGRLALRDLHQQARGAVVQAARRARADQPLRRGLRR